MRHAILIVVLLALALTSAQSQDGAAEPGPWVQKLDAESFDDREKAMDALRDMGEAAREELEAAAASDSAELATRARQLLDELDAAKLLADWKQGEDIRVIGLKMFPGFVRGETAQRFQARPWKFELFGDGRVVYRDHAFNQYTIQLSDEAVLALLAPIAALDILSLRQEELNLPEGQPKIADGGSMSIDLVIGERSHSFYVGLNEERTMTMENAPARLKEILAWIHQLRDWSHEDAEKTADPPDLGGRKHVSPVPQEPDSDE
jgi:hypothetical protein